MIRKLLFSLLTASLLSLPARAARNVMVQVDGTPLQAACYLSQGVTYVPLRSLLEVFGGWDVFWDSEEKEAIAVSGTNRLTADPASNTITLNGTAHAGQVTVEQGKTYVPLRLVTETLEGKAEWDPYIDGAAVTSPGAAYDASDLYWLAHIISAESRGEPLSGQIAVGNVVLNRVRSREFPGSVAEVIFDRVDGVQFEPVENGTVYLDPTPLSMEAARRVLDGEEVVGAALYFYAPALSEGTWINSNREYTQTIGCHRFYL